MKNIKLLSTFCICVLSIACSSKPTILSHQGIRRLEPSDNALHNPIWSPDGNKIVATSITSMHTWTSEIYVWDLATNNYWIIEKTDFGNLMANSWSPDGNRIVFSSQHGGDWPEGIWIADIYGRTSKQFLAEGYNAAWSPDGNTIAYFSTSLEGGNETRILSLMDLKTMQKREIYSGSGKYSTAANLSWSHDGKKLAFSFGAQNEGNNEKIEKVDIYILTIPAGEITQITDGGENYYPTWSPDGNLIAYIHDTFGTFDPRLMIGYADGHCNQQITTDAWSANWSPDGRYVTFENIGSIYIMELSIFIGKNILETGPSCP